MACAAAHNGAENVAGRCTAATDHVIHIGPFAAQEGTLTELKARRHEKNSGKVDEDEVEAAESFELPGADLSHEELTVRVLPRQANEFTCASCFLVKSQSQLAEVRGGQSYCVDCV